MEAIITIDATGRVVIPKAIRRRLGLSDGARLRLVEEDATRLVIEPVADESVPVGIDGLLVIDGHLAGPVADHRDLRDERIARLGGRRR